MFPSTPENGCRTIPYSDFPTRLCADLVTAKHSTVSQDNLREDEDASIFNVHNGICFCRASAALLVLLCTQKRLVAAGHQIDMSSCF